MQIHRSSRMGLGALLLVAGGLVAVGAAETEEVGTEAAAAAAATAPAATTNTVTLGNFAGHWQMTIVGQTGCGFGTAVYSVTLNSAGAGTATGTIHNACGDSATGTVSFNVSAVNSHGTGAAHLSCGVRCGWDLKVQLTPNHEVFNLVDVSNADNFIEGSAVLESN